jgi:hypothetical protein
MANTIASAIEVRHIPRRRQLQRSPGTYVGTFSDFFEEFVSPNLPTPEAIEAFHHALSGYVAEPDPLLLVRVVKGMVKRGQYRTAMGLLLKATDNAPPWWVHYALFQDCRVRRGSMRPLVETIPCHMFDVRRSLPESVNTYGWHLSHLFDVKDGRTDFHEWSREAAIGYFIRNIHPCNHFLLPHNGWQKWGSDRGVLARVAERFVARYAAVWKDFLRLAGSPVLPPADRSGRFPFACAPPGTATDARRRATARSVLPKNSGLPQPASAPTSAGTPKASYRASRLTFKSRVIEPLDWGEVFRVVTPIGTFEMTKADFYAAFPRVRLTVSYRERGIYHFPVLPKAAERFRLEEHEK